MPVAAVIHCLLEEEIETSEITGKALHGLFFSILARSNSRLANHSTNELRPFTIGFQAPQQKLLHRGQELKIRVTFLDDQLFMTFAEGFMNMPGGFRVQQADLAPLMINLPSNSREPDAREG